MGFTKQLHLQRQAAQQQAQENATAADEATAAQIMAEHLPLDPSQQQSQPKLEDSQPSQPQSQPQPQNQPQQQNQASSIPMETADGPTTAAPPPPQPQSLQDLAMLQQLQQLQAPQINIMTHEQAPQQSQQDPMANRSYTITELVPGDFLAVNCGVSVGFVQALSVHYHFYSLILCL